MPLTVLRDMAPCAERPRTLIVMLPGSLSLPQELVREGLVAAVRERGIAADIVIPDAHPAYYANRSILDRLQADIVVPARAAGYRDIWWMGISIGGFGALLHASQYPADAAGVVALAPYLGTREVEVAVRQQGGLLRWRAPPNPTLPEDVDGVLWSYLQRSVRSGAPVYLGYGVDDRLSVVAGLLAEAMPADHVFTAPGGHDYPAWTPLWQRVLDAAPLPRDASCRRAG